MSLNLLKCRPTSNMFKANDIKVSAKLKEPSSAFQSLELLTVIAWQGGKAALLSN